MGAQQPATVVHGVAIHTLRQVFHRKSLAMHEWPIQNPVALSVLCNVRATMLRHVVVLVGPKVLIWHEVDVKQIRDPTPEINGTRVFEHDDNIVFGYAPLRHCGGRARQEGDRTTGDFDEKRTLFFVSLLLIEHSCVLAIRRGHIARAHAANSSQ